MPNEISKLRTADGWKVVTFKKDYEQFLPRLEVCAAAVGYARRNRKQTNYLDCLVQPKNTPEQLLAVYFAEAVAVSVMAVISGEIHVDLDELWMRSWENFAGRKILSKGDDFFGKPNV